MNNIITLPSAKTYPIRSLGMKEAENKFGFIYFFYVPMKDKLMDMILEQPIEDVIVNAIKPAFVPEYRRSSFAPNDSGGCRFFDEYELDWIHEYFMGELSSAVERSLNTMKHCHSFFALNSNSKVGTKFKELKTFLSTYGTCYKPKNKARDELLSKIKRLNPVSINKTDTEICLIPDMPFIGQEFFSVKTNSLNDIIKGEPLFTIEKLKFERLIIDSIDKGANMNVFIRKENSDKYKELFLEYSDEGYQFKMEEKENEVIFEAVEDALDFAETMKTEITKTNTLFNF